MNAKMKKVLGLLGTLVIITVFVYAIYEGKKIENDVYVGKWETGVEAKAYMVNVDADVPKRTKTKPMYRVEEDPTTRIDRPHTVRIATIHGEYYVKITEDIHTDIKQKEELSVIIYTDKLILDENRGAEYKYLEGKGIDAQQRAILVQKYKINGYRGGEPSYYIVLYVGGKDYKLRVRTGEYGMYDIGDKIQVTVVDGDVKLYE